MYVREICGNPTLTQVYSPFDSQLRKKKIVMEKKSWANNSCVDRNDFIPQNATNKKVMNKMSFYLLILKTVQWWKQQHLLALNVWALVCVSPFTAFILVQCYCKQTTSHCLYCGREIISFECSEGARGRLHSVHIVCVHSAHFKVNSHLELWCTVCHVFIWFWMSGRR